jgi:hypothetical protein
MVVSRCAAFSATLAVSELGPQVPRGEVTATPLSVRPLVEFTWPDHGKPEGVTAEHNAWPVNLADVILTSPVLVMLPTKLVVHTSGMAPFTSVVAPSRLIGPAGETVTAKAGVDAATNNANAAPTGMSLRRFIERTSHQVKVRLK